MRLIPIQLQGFSTTVSLGADGKNWLCLLKGRMAPAENAIRVASARLQALRIPSKAIMTEGGEGHEVASAERRPFAFWFSNSAPRTRSRKAFWLAIVAHYAGVTLSLTNPPYSDYSDWNHFWREMSFASGMVILWLLFYPLGQIFIWGRVFFANESGVTPTTG